MKPWIVWVGTFAVYMKEVQFHEIVQAFVSFSSMALAE
jgi:hypothetical protein